MLKCHCALAMPILLKTIINNSNLFIFSTLICHRAQLFLLCSITAKPPQLGALLLVDKPRFMKLLFNALHGLSDGHTFHSGCCGGVQVTTVSFFYGTSSSGCSWTNIRRVLSNSALAGFRFAASCHGKHGCHGDKNHYFFHFDNCLVVNTINKTHHSLQKEKGASQTRRTLSPR